MGEIVWIKWWSRWSSGHGTTEYLDIPAKDKDDEDYIGDMLSQRVSGNTYGEHYRGVEWHIIDEKDVPKEHFDKSIDRLQDRIIELQGRQRFYEDIALRLYNQENTHEH